MKISLSTVEAFKHIKSDKLLELTDNQLCELQHVLMEILYDIDDICSKNHICYFLGGGSALGAVRHQGIIPWDDDVDINMFRTDYERFIQLFQENMSDKYWIHTPEYTKGYALQLARIRKKGTCVKTREDFFQDECGAFVDIFVIDNIPNSSLLRLVHGTGSLGLGFLLSCRKFFRERKYLRPLIKDMPEMRFAYAVKTVVGMFTALLPVRAWVLVNCFWNGVMKNKETEYTTVAAGRNHYWNEMIERSDIFPARKVRFGDRYLPVYHNVEKYLRQLYGNDYMSFPSKDKLEKHILFFPFYLHSEERRKQGK